MTCPCAGRPQAAVLSQEVTVPHSTSASGSVSLQSDVPLELLQLEFFSEAVFEEIMTILHRVIIRRALKLKI